MLQKDQCNNKTFTNIHKTQDIILIDFSYNLGINWIYFTVKIQNNYCI